MLFVFTGTRFHVLSVLQWDMALLQSVPREQLSNLEGSLSVVVPPAAIRAANDCVRQTDEGAKKKRGLPVECTKLSSEKRAEPDWQICI